MNYEIIFKTLWECEDKINDRLQEIEWWSNTGSLGPMGRTDENINEKHCVCALKRLQKDINRLSYYIEHGDKSIEKEYNSVIKSLKEVKAVM